MAQPSKKLNNGSNSKILSGEAEEDCLHTDTPLYLFMNQTTSTSSKEAK
jgi:hypothetical protein